MTNFFLLSTKGHDEFLRHGLVQRERVHDTVSFARLSYGIADWSNRQNDASVDKCLEVFISCSLVPALMMACISFSQPSPNAEHQLGIYLDTTSRS